MARHNVERATGKPSICSNPRRILSYDTPQIIFWNAAKASSLGKTVPTSNAFEISSGCWPRTRDHTPGSHAQVSGWMGGMSTWYRSMLPSAPTLPPQTEPERELGSLGETPACVRASSGPVSACPWRRVRLGACQRAVRHALELGNPGVPFLQLKIRVLHVQSTQLALKPFNPFAQFANRLLQDLNMHCRIAGAAAFVQPLPQRQR